jgi:cysteinyl-tRNA synthetase
MEQAKRSVGRIVDAARKLDDDPSPSWSTALRERFFDALAEDFNTPEALAAVFDWVREANRAAGTVGAEDLREMLGVLALENLLEPREVEIPGEVLELRDARERARAERDFKTADRIREQLRERGWEVRDGPGGPELLPAA